MGFCTPFFSFWYHIFNVFDFLFGQRELLIGTSISVSLPGFVLVQRYKNRLAKQECSLEKYTSKSSPTISRDRVDSTDTYRAKH